MCLKLVISLLLSNANYTFMKKNLSKVQRVQWKQVHCTWSSTHKLWIQSHLTVRYNLKKFSPLKHFVVGPVTFTQENKVARTVTTEAWILGLCCVLLRHEHEQWGLWSNVRSGKRRRLSSHSGWKWKQNSLQTRQHTQQLCCLMCLAYIKITVILFVHSLYSPSTANRNLDP